MRRKPIILIYDSRAKSLTKEAHKEIYKADLASYKVNESYFIIKSRYRDNEVVVTDE